MSMMDESGIEIFPLNYYFRLVKIPGDIFPYSNGMIVQDSPCLICDQNFNAKLDTWVIERIWNNPFVPNLKPFSKDRTGLQSWFIHLPCWTRIQDALRKYTVLAGLEGENLEV
jgi:hypothetical protein